MKLFKKLILNFFWLMRNHSKQDRKLHSVSEFIVAKVSVLFLVDASISQENIRFISYVIFISIILTLLSTEFVEIH